MLTFKHKTDKIEKGILLCNRFASSVKATWKAVTGADGYKVTLYSAKNKAVKTVYTTKTSYTFS